MRIRIPAAFYLPDSSPIDLRRIAVLFVASDDTALAPNALGHVEVKAVLLAGQEIALRYALHRGRRRNPAHGRTFVRRGCSRRQNEIDSLLFRAI